MKTTAEEQYDGFIELITDDVLVLGVLDWAEERPYDSSFELSVEKYLEEHDHITPEQRSKLEATAKHFQIGQEYFTPF